MIVTNHRPKFKDTSEGTWRRLLLAPFEKVVPVENRVLGLAEKIIATELPGVLKWALEGARKLVKNGGFIVPERCKIALEEYRREALPEIEFLEENFEECDPNVARFAVSCEAFRACYELWCRGNGTKPKAAKNLKPTIDKMFPNNTRKLGRQGVTRRYLYFGIAMKDESEYFAHVD